jgi:hypothetical protein
MLCEVLLMPLRFPPWRFSLLTLLGITAYIALAAAALSSANEFWESVAVTLAVAVHPVAAVGLLFRRDRRRAYWTGCLMFAATYTLLVFGPWFNTRIGSRLLTTYALQRFEPDLPRDRQQIDVHRTARAGPHNEQVTYLVKVDAETGLTHGERTEQFVRIGHGVLTPAIGLLGGLLGLFFWRWRDSTANRELPNP